MTGLWDVRWTHYATYAEVAQAGDISPRSVAVRLSFRAAQELVERLGFGHSMHPSAS